MNSDFEIGINNLLVYFHSAPFCAEKYYEKTIGPYEADNNNKNIPGYAWNNFETSIPKYIVNNNNDNYKLFVKCNTFILHLGVFVITIGGCICIDILFKYYKNQC